MTFDRSRTLQELENDDWGEPEYPSHLVTECHRLRRKPLRDFTPEDCRILIGQKLSLPYVVPVALDFLERDPLVEGDFYPGDLLRNVAKVPRHFWETNPDLQARLDAVVDGLDDVPDEVEEALRGYGGRSRRLR